MYHVKSDKRSQTSARMIAAALEACLAEKNYEDITITDIQKRSSVSRSTFYRLFDRMDDVVAYLCDCTHEKILQKAREQGSFGDLHGLAVPALQAWMEQKDLVSLIVSIHREDILYQFHERQRDQILSAVDDLKIRNSFSPTHISLIFFTLVGVLTMWIKGGAKETPEEMADILQTTLSDIYHIMFE